MQEKNNLNKTLKNRPQYVILIFSENSETQSYKNRLTKFKTATSQKLFCLHKLGKLEITYTCCGRVT